MVGCYSTFTSQKILSAKRFSHNCDPHLWQEVEVAYRPCISLRQELVHSNQTSHDHFREVTYIPATSQIRPNIFGPQLTALHRFHCTKIQWTYSKPASTNHSPTFLYHIPHIQLHEYHSLITVSKNAIKQWLSPLIMLFITHTLQMLNHYKKPLKNICKHSILITWKTNPCTTETITPLLTYLLCLSRKGCRARATTTANHGV